MLRRRCASGCGCSRRTSPSQPSSRRPLRPVAQSYVHGRPAREEAGKVTLPVRALGGDRAQGRTLLRRRAQRGPGRAAALESTLRGRSARAQRAPRRGVEDPRYLPVSADPSCGWRVSKKPSPFQCRNARVASPAMPVALINLSAW
jgi:hypothetical protein